jgi:hypothetical protein
MSLVRGRRILLIRFLPVIDRLSASQLFVLLLVALLVIGGVGIEWAKSFAARKTATPPAHGRTGHENGEQMTPMDDA